MQVNPARRAALKELLLFFRDGRYANLAQGAALDRCDLREADRALFTRLYYGVIQRKITMDYLLSHWSDRPLNKLDPAVLVALECGLYQILYMDRVPDRAAVDESVKLVQKEGPGSAGFVNAVLRRASAEKANVEKMLDLPGGKGLSLREGYPRYLVSLWIEQYGRETAEIICREQNGAAPLTLRVNTLKTDKEAVIERLSAAGIPCRISRLCKNGVILEKAASPASLPGWEEGDFFVQDAAAQRAADLLEAAPGETVLDLCAAPGGKSFSVAMDMEDRGAVIATDLHPARVRLIEEGARRLGLTCIRAFARDAALPDPAFAGKADKVLCDVPCTGYGVIAKKPDIRLKGRDEGRDLPEIQGAILRAGAKALRPGGRLVYATCTLNKRENEEVTARFLEENDSFYALSEPETILPRAGENDGFFTAVLEKKA
ncbi:MAG: 16S rRNA (cytosine(967)-C(5))-methyltransferase RsmB [Clostridia bacterium]|nr:16S rRNA (cytosine(967)-C(5))-methyltransferase RsmB [Clostridia bacterium]